MKKIMLAAVLLLNGAGILTSCQKADEVRPVSPVHNLAGFKKDISTAD